MAEENFSITALYRVKTVTSQYMMGEFKQTLDSVRDTNTNNAMLIDQLLSGRIVNAQNSNLQNDYNNSNDDTDVTVLTRYNAVILKFSSAIKSDSISS
jgi:hypothetical protein